MIGALALSGMLASINLLGSMDGLTFEAFVIRKLIPNLWQGAVVVWDNYSIHKGKEIEQAIVAAGASLVYLPPYSPDFNPIENCWSKIKNILRSIGARNYKDLIQQFPKLIVRSLLKIFIVGFLIPVTVSHQLEKGYKTFSVEPELKITKASAADFRQKNLQSHHFQVKSLTILVLLHLHR